MGLHYRKSINLGGGFRINISKSGVGYSWGVKGYRITKTAKGTVRRTVSIPGTGLSHAEENRPRTSASSKSKSLPPDSNHYGAREIVNGNASQMVSSGLEEILSIAKRTIQVNRIANICIVVSLLVSFANPFLLLFLLLSIGIKFYARTAGLVKLDYEIESDQTQLVSQRMDPMLKLSKSLKLWRIMQSSQVIDRKYSGGAGHTVKRVPCQASQNPPFPFKINIPTVSFKAGKEILFFLPDKLFIMQGKNIGALNYSDIMTSVGTTRFIESSPVPKDARVVDHTWQYVNKSGGPDKRFKNNRQLPVCLYGELKLQSPTGLNTIIMFSNAELK